MVHPPDGPAPTIGWAGRLVEVAAVVGLADHVGLPITWTCGLAGRRPGSLQGLGRCLTPLGTVVGPRAAEDPVVQEFATHFPPIALGERR
jgi:hypothetical protein